MHPSQAHCQLPPRETPALCPVEVGGGSTRTARSPPMLGGGCGVSRCTWHPGGFLLCPPVPGTPWPPPGCSQVFPAWLLLHSIFTGDCTLQRLPCFPGAVAPWAGLVRGPCPLQPVAGGSCWPGTGPLEPWEGAGGSKQGPNVIGGTGGCTCVHACPCAGTGVSQDWGTCAAHGGLGSWPGFTPTPPGVPHPPPHLGTFS